MKVKLDPGAYMPEKAHEADGGFDLRTPVHATVWGATLTSMGGVRIGSATIDTGVHVEIPRGCVGLIKSKSGLNVNHGLTADGVIDAGYTGSICVKLYNHTAQDYNFNAGDKVAQLVIVPLADVGEPELVDELEETERGDGGFGSTGR